MAFSLKKVLISDSVSPRCAEILRENGIEVDNNTKLSKEELLAEIPKYDGLIVRSATKVTADVIKAGTNLKIIGRAGTGVDNIDIKAATRQGVIVMNTPGGNTLSAAEHTCAMVCCLSRSLPQAHATLKAGKWDRKAFMGSELYGKTLGIVGLGRIGREVAQRMQSFGMTTIGFDPIVPAEEAKQYNIEWQTLEQMWPRCDYITVHTPLIPQTKGLLGDASFKLCKPGVKVVNVARGGIIDEEGLVRALDAGQCGGAALDVFVQEPPTYTALIQHPKVIVTPHLGASTVEAQERVACEIAEQFVDGVNGKSLFGAINAQALSNALTPETKPMVSLGQGLGVVAASLAKGQLSAASIQVTTYGPSLKKAGSYLKAAVSAGILRVQTGGNNVNLVNAQPLLAELGLEITVNNEDAAPANSKASVAVTITVGGNPHRLGGAVFGTIPQLVEVDSATFDTGCPLSGNWLLYRSQNAAAALAAVASGLGDKNQLLAFSSSAQTNGESWSVIKLATPQPGVEALAGAVSSAVTCSI
ncbi:D-3-phosphoglycerate dehydrogenase [Strongylocentrotus purpuratus]|uniref:D-3-phosphoglycerate dehydrogenase n=1 Tax=Strongylocentrotus purpuratus TaxID=7668 RepID=A0A7M7RH00_STRPU|nr:D-3-phosphoglycerate dehydrogenase [Strongylocentrotus purpuratus]|eukprot:XP_795649.3 PREDICTED: D-3-phosphoglycerate dehydrogenase [Strongylocentrotus purpuratus]